MDEGADLVHNIRNILVVDVQGVGVTIDAYQQVMMRGGADLMNVNNTILNIDLKGAGVVNIVCQLVEMNGVAGHERAVSGTHDERRNNEKLLALLSLVSCQKDDEILRNDFEGPNEDGSYKWAFQTQGGIYHEQRGSLRESAGGAAPALMVEGQYQYTAPDGQIINVVYKADENGGFQATGDHIPTPPPIPPAIQRALAYLATKPPSENDY